MLGIPYGSLWFVLVISLFVFVGLCWIPVVGIQIRLKSAMNKGASIEEIRPLMRIWIALGIPAFLSMIVLYLLMVSKYGTATMLVA
jgi:uncharacterized membrane protein